MQRRFRDFRVPARSQIAAKSGRYDTSLPHSKADVKVFHEKHEVLPGSEPITARSCEQMEAIIQAE